MYSFLLATVMKPFILCCTCRSPQEDIREGNYQRNNSYNRPPNQAGPPRGGGPNFGGPPRGTGRDQRNDRNNRPPRYSRMEREERGGGGGGDLVPAGREFANSSYGRASGPPSGGENAGVVAPGQVNTTKL
jgi:hypothetical protein